MKTIEEHIKEILKSRFSPVSNLDVKIDYAVKDILEALEEAIKEERARVVNDILDQAEEWLEDDKDTRLFVFIPVIENRKM